MIRVHHLNMSRSQRILWLLEELGVPYEVVRYQRDAKTNLAPPELKAIHPLGKSPVIEDDGKIISETGAIAEYLVRAHPKGSFSAPSEQQTFWLHYAEGSAMPPLVMYLVFSRMPDRVPFFLRPVARMIVKGAIDGFVLPQVKTHMAFWEDALAKQEWFGGAEISAADVLMSFPVQAVAARFGVSDYPRLGAFLKRVEERPAYKRALETGGPFSLLQ